MAAPTSPRSASPSRSSAASTSRWPSPSRPGWAWGQPDLQVRHRGAAPAVAAGPLRRPGARRLRADRARGGQRRRRHPHPGRARRGHRRVGGQRREGVHHQLGHPITSLVTVTARTDPPGSTARPRSPRSSSPRGRPASTVQPPVPEDGLARLGHPRAVLRRLPGPGREPPGRAGPGLRQLPRHPRRRPHRHRRPGRRGDPGLPGPVGRLRRDRQPSDARSAPTRQSPSAAPTWR